MSNWDFVSEDSVSTVEARMADGVSVCGRISRAGLRQQVNLATSAALHRMNLFCTQESEEREVEFITHLVTGALATLSLFL